MTMSLTHRLGLLPALASLGAAASAQTVAVATEKDYLAEVPVVLSVSRLPQRLDETPGAMTIIDRDMIRLSGARDVADLLRLVPGFRVSSGFESNSPMGSYHADLGDFNTQLQVLVDGRSVYSPFLNGATGPGLQTVALEDIDHIEVHRGSNSATYGARSFLGTINIVTRSAADSQGTALVLRGGDNQIQDIYLRHGWGDDRAAWRLSADQRADRGQAGSSGPAHVGRVNFRGDVQLQHGDQLEVRLGQSVISAGVGFAGEYGNAPRTRRIETDHLQLDWRHNLGVDEDLSLQYAYMQEHTDDFFRYLDPNPPYNVYYGGPIDFGGQGSSHSLLLTHTSRWGSQLRLAWGGEWRRESLQASPRFDTADALVTEFARLFINAEWRLRPTLILNAGGTYESNSISSDVFSPRAMLNWHVRPGHTLRYGLSQAHRTPGFFEQYAKITYRDLVTGAPLLTTYQARGQLQPEYVLARELGYLGYWGASAEVDVRVFDEGIRGLIKEAQDAPGQPKYFVNGEDYSIRGAELQLKWRPWRDAQLHLAHSYTESTKSLTDPSWQTPVAVTGALLAQRLPAQLELSLAHYQIDSIQYPSRSARAPAMHRTDVRLAKGLRLGGRPAELALVVQNLGPAYADAMPELTFRTQAYVALRMGL
jgi:iron complex outermembrane receptor protein